MSTPEKRSHTDPDSVYPRKDYHAPRYSLGESLPKPKPRSIDELLALDLDCQHATFPEDKRVYEALREARALLEKITSAGYLGEPDDRMLPHVAASLTLLEKWKG